MQLFVKTITGTLVNLDKVFKIDLVRKDVRSTIVAYFEPTNTVGITLGEYISLEWAISEKEKIEDALICGMRMHTIGEEVLNQHEDN